MAERKVYGKPGEDIVVIAPADHTLEWVSEDAAHTRVRFRPKAVPPPDPPPPTGGHLFGVDLMTLPTSGVAWTGLRSWADKTTMPDLRDQNNQGDVVTLAQALVGKRTGDTKYLTACRGRLAAVTKTAGPGVTTGDTLGMVRGMAAIALAAELIDYREPAFVTWMRDMLTWENPDRDYTIRSTQEKRPNNWGTHAGASRVAMALYLGDKAELDKAAQVFAGFLGDRFKWSEDHPGGFVYGDLMWQADPSKPVGVNPKGSVRYGMSVDGIIPDDMRRGNEGSSPPPPAIGTAGKSYTYECLQGVLLTACLLKAQRLVAPGGFLVTEWQDQAVKRAYDTAIRLAGNPSGDDKWQPFAMKYLYGYSASGTASPGKGVVGLDWIYG